MSKNLKKIVIIAFFMFPVMRLLAQQDPQFTQYMFNTLYYNPGFAGVDGVTKLTAMHRSQWLGYQPTYGGGGAPTTQIVSMTTPLFKINSGFGAYVVNDIASGYLINSSHRFLLINGLKIIP